MVIGTETCAAVPGGLVAGIVKDANTGDPLNGAAVTEASKDGGTVTSATTGDPAIPGGFYWMFSPQGEHSFTAADAHGYATATQTAAVARNAVTQQDWALQAGRLTVTPASPSATVTLGGSTIVKLTYTNTGSAALHVALGVQDGGFTPTRQSGATAAGTVPAGSAWTGIAPYPIPVADNAVATDPQNGDVYSVGGQTKLGNTDTAASYVYDPSTQQWSPIASPPVGDQGVQGAGAAFLDGTLYLIGGSDGPGTDSPISSAVYAYTLGTNTWSQMASLPVGVADPGIAVLDGQLYVIGGCTQGPGCVGQIGNPSTGMYRYNPAANTWTKLARYPTPVGAEACAGIDGEIACAGGETTIPPTRATWLYDPASNHWTQGADMPYPAQQMAYAGANGKLQIAGGQTGEVENNIPDTRRVSQYDPATNTWTALPPLKTPVFQGGGSCGMYLIGGDDYTAGYQPPLSSAQQLPGYDQCDGAGDTGWVKPDQAGFDLAAGASVTVTVRLDSAKVDQPGTYQAMLSGATNAPYPVQVISVTMVVQPPQGWSLLSGKITDAAGSPIAGATVQVDTSASSVKSGRVDYTLKTGDNGTYQWWIDTSADDPLQVITAKDGYIQQVTTIRQPRTSLKVKLNPFPSLPY